jgi:GTP-binding protein
MQIKSAKFIKSSARADECPVTTLPEYAFIGRSNVGKSSLINMLTNHSKLAKTSGRPGKTQLINHFLINENWYLVDLPGYGYAKVSKELREKFDKLITHYIMKRANLRCVFVLVDSRIPPQPIDISFMNNLGENNIPFCIVFTKCDKQSKNQIQKMFAVYKKELLNYWEELPNCFFTSSESKMGREELMEFIEEHNQLQ